MVEMRMPLQNIVGVDHAVVLVRDLDQAAANWSRLGFTVAPRGTHSPPMGTGNYTIMFGSDYIELIGVLAETPHNAPSRALLDRRGEGLERVAFTTTDAAQGVKEIRARGWPGIGPIDFGRPVSLPGGGQTEARFRVFQWPLDEAPGGVRIFACEHLTRDAVWIPELQTHPNTALRIDRIEIVVPNPRSAAEHMARLIDREVAEEADGALRVPSGADRAAFVFLTGPALAARYRHASSDGVPREGAAALVIAVDSLEAAARAAGPSAIAGERSVCVPPGAANGVLLLFEQG